MAQNDTNEGDEDNKLIEWLTSNRLLKVKEKFIDYQVSMNDLKTMDLDTHLTFSQIKHI